MKIRCLLLLFIFSLFSFGQISAAKSSSLKFDKILSIDCPQKVEIGTPFLVEVTTITAVDAFSISWMGREAQIKVDSITGQKGSASFLLGSDVGKDKPGIKKLFISYKNIRYEKDIEIIDKKYPEQRLTVEPSKVDPPKESLKRIALESKEIHKALALVTNKRYWNVPMTWPLGKHKKITSAYGLRRVFNGKPKNPHRGLDLDAKIGDSVYAVSDGRVILVAEHYFSGNSIYIDHGNGVMSLYFHLSKFNVLKGDFVKAGDLIGFVGKTGRVTGPHLHLSISILGKLVDPKPLLDLDEQALRKGVF